MHSFSPLSYIPDLSSFTNPLNQDIKIPSASFSSPSFNSFIMLLSTVIRFPLDLYSKGNKYIKHTMRQASLHTEKNVL